MLRPSRRCLLPARLLPALLLACAAPPPSLTRPEPGVRHRAVGESVAFAPGQTIPLLETPESGRIQRIWITLDDVKGDPFSLRTARLEMTWDGDAAPAVRVPLGDLFGAAHGVGGELISEPATVLGRGLTSYWPMPFSAARITLTNDGPAEHLLFWQVDWLATDEIDPARFQASFRRDPKAHATLRVAELTGQGHYVGTVLGLVPLSAGWWGEGDDRYLVDGIALLGTGTEDFVNQAWGLEPRSTPYAGVLDGRGRRATLYRWMVRDPIPFARSLVVEHELQGYKKRGDRTDDVSATALWYQVPPLTPLPDLPSVADRLPGEALPVESWALPTPATPIPLAPHATSLARTGDRFRAPLLALAPTLDGARPRKLAGVELAIEGCGQETACGWRIREGEELVLPVDPAGPGTLYLLVSARGEGGEEVLRVTLGGETTPLRIGTELGDWADSWPVPGGRMLTLGEDGTTLHGAFVVPIRTAGASSATLGGLTEDGVALWAASVRAAPP